MRDERVAVALVALAACGSPTAPPPHLIDAAVADAPLAPPTITATT